MTYEEIKRRLTSCESKLKELQIPNNPAQKAKNYTTAVQKLTILKESLQKQLKEAEKTAFINGKPSEYKDEKELQKFKDNSDVKSIETADGKKIKEADSPKFSVEETKSIATKVGKAVAKALHTLGDEVAHMKAKKIEESSFEIYVQYKNDSDDQFSFYITDDTLHLVDFSFDKEISDVGVKPSGEAVVNVDVVSNELVKHFKSLGSSNEGMSDEEWADAKEKERLDAHPEKDTILKIKSLLAKERENQLKEAPDGMFYIEVSIRDARRASAIMDDQYGKNFEMNGSNVYYFTDEQLAYDAMMDLGAQGIEVVDTNVDEDNLEEYKSDYAKRRAAERDYQPSKRDVPPKKYKEPKNDYFARRKAEMDEGEEQYTVAGRPVKLHKGESSDGTDWSVEFENGKTAELSSVLALIKPFPQGITAEGDVDAQVDGGDLDVGHQDDEPDMLMKDIYDIATYAAKLHKMLKKYNDFDGEVDFPQWWQKKVILARDYISAAQHYLEAEEKQPALDQLALEAKDQGASKEQETEFHKVIKEDWGGSDQRAMNQSIHRDLGEPKSMPSPFSQELESAVESAVDFYWDDWEEYQTDRDGLIDHAKKAYLRDYFKETFNKMVQMFSESESDVVSESVAKIQKAHGLVVAKMKELAKVYKSGDSSVIAQLKDLTVKKKQLEKQLEKAVAGTNRNQQLDPNGIDENQDIPDVTDMSVVSGGKRYVDMEDMEGNIEIEPGMLVSVKGKTYKVTDIEKGDNYLIVPVEQEQVNEEKATCCGKCGRVHVKGTKCKTPYLKGKDHCRTK